MPSRICVRKLPNQSQVHLASAKRPVHPAVVGSGHPIVEFRLAPSARLEGAARQVGEAIARARASGARGLLVIVPPGGVPTPTAAERDWLEQPA